MPKRHHSKNKQVTGFSANNKTSINATAKHYIKERKWEEVIEALKKNRPKAKTILKDQIQQTFKEAVNAAEQNRDLDSIILHCELLALEPKHLMGLRNLSLLLKRSGQNKDALHFINQCIKINPNCSDTQNTLGTILADLGQNNDAIQAFKKSLTINPSNSNACNNLANQYHLNAQIDQAFIYSSLAVNLECKRPTLWLDHLTHLRRVCDHERLEKINWWEVINNIPQAFISSSFLQVLTLSENIEQQLQLRRTVERWGQEQLKKAEEQPLKPFKNPILSEETPLQIGFISADFRDHSVARFIWPLFEHLDREKFSLNCYSTFQEHDSWRARFEASTNRLREVHDLSPQQLSEIIRGDGIHVLFDLTGFTNGSRTGSLAWRAAPAQVSWLGFPGTSGLETMDYLFLDQYLAPTHSELITEKALISDGTTVCFTEIAPVPITPTIPELNRGFLTFGTLNNTYKMTRKTIQRWASILSELPNSQFLFVRREFESYLLRQNIIKEFEGEGINSERIHFYNNRKENRHYLDCYNEIDITLDTFPVTGGTTTTDALWMGVPVVGLQGPNIHQRVCSAILHHAGHPEWIAHTDEEFKQIALTLAENQAMRINLRQSLREEIKRSPLCNSKKFAQDFSLCMNQIKQSLNTQAKNQ